MYFSDPAVSQILTWGVLIIITMKKHDEETNYKHKSLDPDSTPSTWRHPLHLTPPPPFDSTPLLFEKSLCNSDI